MLSMQFLVQLSLPTKCPFGTAAAAAAENKS